MIELEFVREYKSVVSPVVDGEVEDFIVLSGANGAGKSHLLEAINGGAVVVKGITSQPGIHGDAVRFLALGQLRVNQGGDEVLGAYGNRWRTLSDRVHELLRELSNKAASGRELGSDDLEELLRDRLLEYRDLTADALSAMTELSGKRLADFDEDDFRKHAPLMVGVRDPFTLTISEVFLSYHARLEANEYARWREDTGRPSRRVTLNDDEFYDRYGPAPWDLVNEILSAIGLDYQINPPVSDEESQPYKLRLTHQETGVEVQVSQLSSGETTLLAIAMSLYSGAYLGEATRLPKVLLLDEPDASLHPSMTRSLLRVIEDVFVKRHGMKVILATHSPTTVALAPEESLYTIRRVGDPRLRRASRDEALKSLMVGLPTLSVRDENRRPVFVESEHDETCYQQLFRFLKDKLNSPLSLEFIASGRGGQGNVDAVRYLVKQLRDAGNLVRGVVDRDDRKAACDGIVFVANRRTLENLVLDPLLIGLLLMRERFIESEEILGQDLANGQIRPDHAQAICDYVIRKIQHDDDAPRKVTARYAGGFETSMPGFIMDMDGKQLEGAIRTAFPVLERYRGGALMANVIELVVRDQPEYAPQDILDLFIQLIDE